MRFGCMLTLACLFVMANPAPGSEPDQPVGTHAQGPHSAAVFEPAAPQQIKGKVAETMDAGRYTYVLVDTGDEQIWAAAPKVEVQVGDSVIVPQGSLMTKHYSPTLDKTFDSIYFVAFIALDGQAGEALVREEHAAAAVAAQPAEVDFSGLAKAEGGRTIGEIYDAKASVAGQEVSVRGRVVKFTPAVMGKNWIHLQDGTKGAGDNNDLTVTSDGMAEVGNTILVRGVVAIDRDFGFGYEYELIIEDADITVE